MEFSVTANYVDIVSEKIYPATIHVLNRRIHSITPLENCAEANDLPYAMPGFVDAHVHIESSMLIPSEFARLAVVHGTVGSISDPHEIANVCGMKGVEFMIDNGKKVPFKFHFGAPSCVPATVFETAGATLNPADVESLLQRDDVYYLSEVMNYPGVLHGDPDMLDKIAAAKKVGKPVDGHAPGLRGEDVLRYAAAGITTDHECFTKEEALDKLRAGMKVIIREGSAARNFEALIALLEHWPDQMMFCSDDKHPDNLLEGHINQLCARSVAKGIPLFSVLKAATINPVRHYNMEVGLLQPGDSADFVIVNNLKDFEVMATYVDGALVAEGGHSHIDSVDAGDALNQFDTVPLEKRDLTVVASGETITVILAEDGQLVTGRWLWNPNILNGAIMPDTGADVLKLVVYNRYKPARPAVAFIKNMGLKKGAIASTVAHDSHNIIAVGTNDEDITRAINLMVETKGGLAAVNATEEKIIPLPFAGLMSAEDGFEIARQYIDLDSYTKDVLGSTLRSPFMTLSFMALLVIPHLKLSDLGLFDGDSFSFVA